MTTPSALEYVTIARIRKVRGRRGEVAAEILTDFPERFQPGEPLWLLEEGGVRPLQLQSSWFHKGLAILKFHGFETISAAESLVGRQVQIPRSERRPAPPGAAYISDLIGCSVLEDNQSLGTVQALEETGAVPLLKVATAQGELLIPLAQDICHSVDVERKEIRVRLPEGLKELNRETSVRKQRRIVARERGRNPR